MIRELLPPDFPELLKEIPDAPLRLRYEGSLPKEKNKYLHITRILFGRKEDGYKESGLLKEINGEKISSNIILLPQEERKKIIEILNKEKIEYTFKEILV